MKIAFFETASWEEALLKASFPQAILTPQKLNKDIAKEHSDAEIISTFIYSPLDEETLAQFPNLKLIATRSTGFDHIDVDYCRKNGIKIANVPEYGSNTVAEHTFALILSLTRKVYQSINQTRSLNFSHENLVGIDLAGKTLGIIGLGKIGENVLRIGLGFGMNVKVYTRTHDESLLTKYSFGYTDLENLISTSDIVTLHLPLNDKTRHIINRDNILNFKKGSYLINTARGGLVETEALLIGVDRDILDGVGLDVLEEESEMTEELEVLAKKETSDNLRTLVINHVLINHPKVIITPHNAFNSIEALDRIDRTTTENIQSFLQGKAENIVS